jgi:uncharacterized protein YrrD
MQLYIGGVPRLPLYASDGRAGAIVDVYVDERTWRLAYLVVGGSVELENQTRLVAAKNVDWSSVALGEPHTKLSRAQIFAGECPEKHPTVSLLHTTQHRSASPRLGLWRALFGAHRRPSLARILNRGHRDTQTVLGNDTGSPLRSTRELLGYRVITVTGRAGRLHDLIADSNPGRVFAVVVRRDGWLRRTHALLPTASVTYASWYHKVILADFPKEEMVVLRTPSSRDRVR